MKVLVIDGQGGGLGRQLVEAVKGRLPQAEIMAVGTNALATQAMIKAGAHHAATGENAVIVACRTADVIVGPIGMVIADSLWGEVTPAMALAIAQSGAERVLLPTNLCGNYVAGVAPGGTGELIEDCVRRIAARMGEPVDSQKGSMI